MTSQLLSTGSGILPTNEAPIAAACYSFQLRVGRGCLELVGLPIARVSITVAQLVLPASALNHRRSEPYTWDTPRVAAPSPSPTFPRTSNGTRASSSGTPPSARAPAHPSTRRTPPRHHPRPCCSDVLVPSYQLPVSYQPPPGSYLPRPRIWRAARFRGSGFRFLAGDCFLQPARTLG